MLRLMALVYNTIGRSTTTAITDATNANPIPIPMIQIGINMI